MCKCDDKTSLGPLMRTPSMNHNYSLLVSTRS